MSKVNKCKNCDADNLIKARFCQQCGYGLTGLRGKISAMKQKIEYQAKEKIEEIRKGLDGRIQEYLHRLDDSEEMKVGSITIPESKRDTVRNALLSFQDRIGGDQEVELSEEFQHWLNDLPQRLDQQNCIICFSKWQEQEDIVVCRHCQSGGHRSHLDNWLVSNHICPLCRATITKRDLITVKLVSE
ncbi:MAG: RING finger domain-containing protein [Candidatus Kariarchaeaceae archaeon]